MDRLMCWWCGPWQVLSLVDLHPFLAESSNPLLLCSSSYTGFLSQSHNWVRPLLGSAHLQVLGPAKVSHGRLSTSRPTSSPIAGSIFTAGNNSSLLFLQSVHGLSVEITLTLPCVMARPRGRMCLPVCGSWCSRVHSHVYRIEGTLVYCIDITNK